MSGTVYLIAQPTIARNGRLPNLEPAAKFGPIRTLIEGGEYPTFNAERCLRAIADRLKTFDPDRDFLVWAGGDTLSAVMVGSVLADMGIDYVWWLRYERGKDANGQRTDVGATYTPVKVPITLCAPPDARQHDLFHPNEGAQA